jgi:GNAT superfamily N-acetyltransferase
LRDIERLEQFWQNLVLTFPAARVVDGAVMACNPELPMPQCNHAANIKVDEDEAEDLLKRVTEYFLSEGSPSVRFRITPSTRPATFSSFLERHGFEKEEESVMVFKGRRLDDKLNPGVKVKEISKSEMDIWSRLLTTLFDMPNEWREQLDKLLLTWLKKGARFYLAYVKGKPVGTCTLFSLERTGGIFNVGTLKEYRRRGVGTTLTLTAVSDSINEGNGLHTLQTTKGGNAERLYREIGFVTDHTSFWFAKKL